MAIYRKVEVQMWRRGSFPRLSPIQPSGQALWLYLLTCPESTAIPGVIHARESGLAEALGWSLEAFREAFREVLSEGMAKADWRAGLVWLPGSLERNAPASPNVVRSWKTAWELTPDCELKIEIFRHVKGFAEGLSEGFAKAFTEAFPKGFGNPSPNQDTGYRIQDLPPPTPSPSHGTPKTHRREGAVEAVVAAGASGGPGDTRRDPSLATPPPPQPEGSDPEGQPQPARAGSGARRSVSLDPRIRDTWAEVFTRDGQRRQLPNAIQESALKGLQDDFGADRVIRHMRPWALHGGRDPAVLRQRIAEDWPTERGPVRKRGDPRDDTEPHYPPPPPEHAESLATLKRRKAKAAAAKETKP